MILILGAGPAGLATATHLDQPYLILEREAEPGGLCRSFAVGASTFDIGGHAFFTKDQQVLDLIESAAPRPLFKQPRAAWIWSHGAFLPYPFQANLSRLPPPIIEDCLVGLLERGEEIGVGNLDGWLKGTFGGGVYRHFLGPYNRKVWAFPLEDILPQWVGERIVQPDLRAIVRGALRDVAFGDFPNAHVRYPSEGGFFELFRPLAERVAERTRLSDAADELDLAARRVRTSSGHDVSFDRLVSTVALPTLCEITKDLPRHVREAAADLDHNSLILVSLSVRGAASLGRHRIYCADPAVYFHKLVFNETSSPALSASGMTSIQAEISTSPHRAVNRDDVIENTRDALVAMGVLDNSSQIEAVDVREVEFGYPVYTARSLKAAQLICEYFEDHGVLSIGRFGEWLYVNSDGAMRRGMEAAAHLARQTGARLERPHWAAGAPSSSPRLSALQAATS